MAGCRGSRRAPAVTLPVGLDLTGRRVVVVGGGAGVAVGRLRRCSPPAARSCEVVAPWLCEELADLAASGEVAWTRSATTPGGDDLDGAWLVVAGAGDRRVDDAVRADALGRPGVVPRRRRTPDGGTADPAGHDVAWRPPTAPSTVAAHAPGDPALATDVVRARSTGCSPAASLDLRRAHPRPGVRLGRPRRRRPGRRRPAHQPRPRAARRRPTSSSSTGSRRAAVVDRLPASCASSTSARPPAGTPCRRTRSTTLLVEEALAGRAVVRLKGGDPYVLGRGGEERLACEAHGIRVEVVPGVTSAVAVPAAAGIPRHPPGRGPRVHRRHRPRRAARGAARHRPHRRAAHGRRPAGPLGAVAAGCRAARHPARSRSSSAASCPTSG